MNTMNYKSFMHTPSSNEINIIKKGIDALKLENKVGTKLCNTACLFLAIACVTPALAISIANAIESYYGRIIMYEKNWAYYALAIFAIFVEICCFIYNTIEYKRTDKKISKLNGNCLVVETDTRKCDILSSGVMVTSEPIANTDNIVLFHTDYEFAEQNNSDRKILIVVTEDENIYAMSKLPDGSVLAGRWAEIVNLNS